MVKNINNAVKEIEFNKYVTIIGILFMSLYSYSQAKSLVLITESIKIDEEVIDSLFETIDCKVYIHTMSNILKSDSIFESENHAIRIKTRWTLKPSYYNNWYGAENSIWVLHSVLEIKKDSLISEYIVSKHPIESKWIYNCYRNLNSNDKDDVKQIHIDKVIYPEFTNIYTDSILIKYGKEGIYYKNKWIFDFKYSKHGKVEFNNTDYTELQYRFYRDKNKMKVIYMYIDPNTNEIVKKDFGKYDIKE